MSEQDGKRYTWFSDFTMIFWSAWTMAALSIWVVHRFLRPIMINVSPYLVDALLAAVLAGWITALIRQRKETATMSAESSEPGA